LLVASGYEAAPRRSIYSVLTGFYFFVSRQKWHVDNFQHFAIFNQAVISQRANLANLANLATRR
jgi:hypothetical protein